MRGDGLLNLIALLRVSTDAQDVARQRADIEKLKKRFPSIRILRIVELIGVSGTDTLENEHVQKILEELQQEGIDGIAISALDRLFRPAKRWAQWGILDFFCDTHKCIWSQREGFIDPTTDEGREKCLAAGGRAGAEWLVLKQRTHDGKVEKAKAGFLPHGNARYGFDVIGRKHTGIIGEGKAVINENEAAVVREVFRWADCDMATYEIAARLNNEGIRSKGSNGNPPAAWSRDTILQMLRCTDYIGQHHWKGIMIPVPRIISDELFYRVQAKMAARKAQWIGRPSKLYLLRGYLWCRRCKRRCVGHKHRTYMCGNKTNKPPQKRCCDAPTVTVKSLEAVAWGAIWRLLKNPRLLLQMGRAIYADNLKPDDAKVARIEKQLAKLRTRDGNLEAMQEDAASPEEYNRCRDKRTALRGEIATLEVELREARKVITMPSLSALEAHLATIITGEEPTTYDERRPILDALVDLKMEYEAGELDITGKIAVAVGQQGEKCYPGVQPDSISTLYIPFILNVKVAA